MRTVQGGVWGNVAPAATVTTPLRSLGGVIGRCRKRALDKGW
ncbi:hypothetical protein [Bosea sp. 2KB_26]